MTKEELIKAYCTNKPQTAEYMKKTKDNMSIAGKYKKQLDTQRARIHLESASIHADEMNCSGDNYESAFRVLRKDHGIEKEEDIKCDIVK